jgi:hypothetical protein
MPNSSFMPAGNVVGPASATDSGFAQYDGATGQLIKNHAGSVAIGSEVSGLGSNVAAFLGTPSSANLAATVTGETGSGALVFADTPTLVTPNIGAATGTSVNLSGNARAASFNVGAAAGVDATVVIPVVGTLTISKGIVTGFA